MFGRLAGLPARKVARVVLDARAVAHFQEHLHVIPRSRRQPLGFQQLALFLQLLEPLLQLVADRLDGPLDSLLGKDEVLGRVNVHLLVGLQHVPGERVDRRQPLDLVAEQLDPVSDLLVGRPELHHVAPHAELAPLERDIIAVILDVHELQEHLVAVHHVSQAEVDHHLAIVLGRAQAVDARHAGHHDHVLAADQGAGARQPKPLDLLVDRGVLLDVDVALGDVGLGLVIVVIADEVADRVVREELVELGVELGRQGLVVRHDQRRLAVLGNHVGHGERLARSGHAHQRLIAVPVAQPPNKLLDRLGLIAGRLKRTDKLKCGHEGLASNHRVANRHRVIIYSASTPANWKPRKASWWGLLDWVRSSSPERSRRTLFTTRKRFAIETIGFVRQHFSRVRAQASL